MAVTAKLVFAVLLLSSLTAALNNGLGRTPAMGYSSWNDCSSDVTEAHIKNITQFLLSSGLAAKGYIHVNVDEGWLKTRDANGRIVSDPVKFPSGMAALGQWIHAQQYAPGRFLKYGLYTSRGTCQCSTDTYHGPGTQGYERQDAQYFADAGADYLKEDSCCGSQDHEVAFADYARMRDALNSTGRPIYFSLCGWEDWYAPVGASLGNSWRISGDGSGWGPLTVALNKMAYISQFAGPGGWNDPDLLIGPNVKVGGQSDLQSRTQFSLWAVLAAPLLISSNLLEASAYALETWGNAEVIAINQDPLGYPGFRLAGGDMTYPCGSSKHPGALFDVEVQDCNPANPLQRFAYLNNKIALVESDGDGVIGVLDVYGCALDDNSPVVVYPDDSGQGTCGGRSQQWALDAQDRLINANSHKCLDVYDFAGPQVEQWTCNGGTNQMWYLGAGPSVRTNQSGKCLTAVAPDAQCTNVWGRVLSRGWALAMLNNGPATTNVTCDAFCFQQLLSSHLPANTQVPTTLAVRDVWAHSALPSLVDRGAGFTLTATVPGDGGVRLFTLM